MLPNIILPQELTKCICAFGEHFASKYPRRTLEWHPLFSECTVRLNLDRPISITCSAVIATILSLFETPETVITHSDIEAKTGINGVLLTACMHQLCAKRPHQGMRTGFLQVIRRLLCICRFSRDFFHFRFVCFQAHISEPSYRFHPK